MFRRNLAPPSSGFLQEPYGVTFQKTQFFIVTAVKTSNLTIRLKLTHSKYSVHYNMKVTELVTVTVLTCRESLLENRRTIPGFIQRNRKTTTASTGQPVLRQHRTAGAPAEILK
jgi:hypothetical protein